MAMHAILLSNCDFPINNYGVFAKVLSRNFEIIFELI